MACVQGGGEFQDGLVSIIGKGETDEQGHAVLGDYCFNCGIDELRKRLRGIPFTIEVPH